MDPLHDSATLDNLPFPDYICRSRAIIQNRRPDLQAGGATAQLILEANSPFEMRPPTTDRRIKTGALLVHGLLDCPFSLKDLSTHLHQAGVLCRAIILPGHGTLPADLITISYHDWLRTLRYAIASLRKEVDEVYLVGYSTGAALSIYHALQDDHIAGIVMLAPAIRIKTPVDIVVGWHYLYKWFSQKNVWVYQEKELDYAKYLSIPFNAVNQVSQLILAIHELRRHQELKCPILMAVSREDEIISSHYAIDFFVNLQHPESKLLLYAANPQSYADARILVRSARYPELNINHFSHIAIPFSPQNSHYGQNGDYLYASRGRATPNVFGAYNRIEEKAYALLYKLKRIKNLYCALTYNPDFNFMATQIAQFMCR